MEFTIMSLRTLLAKIMGQGDATHQVVNISPYSAASGIAAHLVDTSDAHDASAISILDTANDFTATDVEGALAEIQSDNEAHVAAADPHTGYVLESLIAAKGDLYAGAADNTVGILTAGTNDFVLTAASGEATGLKWAAAAGGSDPLTLTNYLAIGADPATAGAIRLSQSGAIAARNKADSANYNLLNPSFFTNGMDNYDLLEIGGSDIVFDPDYNSQLALLNSRTLVVAAAATYGDGDALGDGQQAQVNVSGFAASDGAGAAFYSLTAIADAVQLVYRGLPATDPDNTGQVYTMDAAGLAAELAAGSRYLLISDGS